MENKRKNSFDATSIPGFALIVISCLVATYAGTVMTLDWLSSLHGKFDSEVEAHLLVLDSALLLIRQPEVAWFCLMLLGFTAWRLARRGWWPDLWVLLPTISFAVIAVSAVYANHVLKTRPDKHADAMRTAILADDQKRLRELAFACKLSCGFERDSGPLVWLVERVDTSAVGRADINTIGRMLTMKAARSEVSGWLDEPRTPLEVAIDRYVEDPTLVFYLLGVQNHGYRFEVPPAPQRDRDATLIYAVGQHAPLPLIQKLLWQGANPTTVVKKTTALQTAERVAYSEALEGMRNGFAVLNQARHQPPGTKAESD